MNRIIQAVAMAMLMAFPVLAEEPPQPYVKITMSPVLSHMITRDQTDRVYSGQIKSQTGLAEFEKVYGIALDKQNVDFTKQMLIFGVTDNISTRAFQFLKQERIRSFTLDYADTGIKYKMLAPGEGKKHSYLQVFILDRIDGISHVKVKNLVVNGLSKVYEK